MKRFLKLMEIIEDLMASGMNDLDPVVRSIERKAWKIRWRLNKEEQEELERIEYGKYMDECILENAR